MLNDQVACWAKENETRILGTLSEALDREDPWVAYDVTRVLGVWGVRERDLIRKDGTNFTLTLFTQVVSKAINQIWTRITDFLRGCALHLFAGIFDMIERLGYQKGEFILMFFDVPWLPDFLNSVSLETVDCMHHFLVFLRSAFSSPDLVRSLEKADSRLRIDDAKKLAILNFLWIPLCSDEENWVALSSRALARVIFTKDVADFCFENGFADRLFGLLETVGEFYTKKCVFEAICALVTCASFPVTQRLVDMGFFEYLNDVIEGMCNEIPHPILDALGSLERHAEVEGRNDWYEAIFGNDRFVSVIENLTRFRHGTRDDAFFGMSVSHNAIALLARSDNL
jgi:hypothetical protein